MRNHSYENYFDLHENETACRTHFHMKGFALKTHFETEAQENSEMAYCAGLLRFLQVLRIIYIDDSYAKFNSPVVQIYLAVLAIANSFIRKTVSDCVLRDTN